MNRRVDILKKIRLNPIVKKEMISTSRNIKIPIVLFLINAILGLVCIAAISSFSGIEYEENFNTVSSIIFLSEDWRTICMGLMVAEFIVLFVFISVFTASAMAEEREKQTYEMLITTSYSRVKIIVGKIMTGIIIIMTFMISTLPFLVLMFSYYFVEFRYLLLFLLYGIITGIFLGSVSACIAARVSSARGAGVAGFVGMFIFVAGTLLYALLYTSLKDLIINWDYYINDNYLKYTDVQMGAVKYIYLFNPALTVDAVLSKILGCSYLFRSDLNAIISSETSFPEFIMDNWIWISTVLQLIVAVLLIWFASKRIDPLYKKKKYLKTRAGDDEI